ncbi:HlyD family secretion protein [Aneurinibacillus tyrosinisolvens]|uniref:HlyD family secretion protein n=1 Tax=Aneurinibacillus tyrosinisolvens TaxID=1443435 RepID=UPI00063F2C49|nr:HlyD family efflux transporter periplasmic adaptor subunit [Aneurinibacillus tyrosinisolvens]
MNRKKLLIFLLAIIVLGGGGIGYYYWYQGKHYVKTDDARIQGDTYRILPQIAGEITSMNVEEGDTVQQNQAIAQQDTSNMDPSMIDKSVLRAPVSGTIIKLFSKDHEMASPSSPVGLMVDMNDLYVSANIEETYVDRIQPGQVVDVTIDTLNGQTLKGKVRRVGKASNSMFSLLPATNTSGNFNKVTQRVPIEISLGKAPGLELIPGTNVEVKIHVS